MDCDSVRQELGKSGPGERLRTLGPLQVQEIRRLAQADQLVEKTVIIKPEVGQEDVALAMDIPSEGITYTEQVALFSLEEMEDLAGQSELKLVASAGSYGGLPLGQGPRWILVFRKEQEN